MIALIRNEFYKLHHRHFFIISVLLILVSITVFTGIFYIQVDTRNDMDIVNEQLEREKAYFSQIESIQWETDLEMQSAILTSQATIDRLQYMLEHGIPAWDWRSDVLSKYYTNQTIISLLNNGQNPEDYGYTDLGSYESKAGLQQRLASQCDVQKNMVETNDYMSYSQEQLASLQQRYSQNYSSMTTLEAAIMDIEIESWKMYIQYMTPPGAIDQWKSVTIAELAEQKEWLARNKYDETFNADLSNEELNRQYTWTKRQIRINEYALSNDTISLSIYDRMAENANTVTFSSYLISLKNMMLVVMAICILLSGVIMSGEFHTGTIRQLVMPPNSRTQIALAKLVTVVLTVLMFSVIVPAFGMIAGRILFSKQTIGMSLSSGAIPVYIANLRNHIVEIPFHLFILLNYLFEILKILVLATITLAISTAAESMTLPTLIMLILSLIGPDILSTVYTFVYPVRILRYLLFGNLNLIQYITSAWVAPYPTAITSIIMILICNAGALALYFVNFKYKEIGI